MTGRYCTRSRGPAQFSVQTATELLDAVEVQESKQRRHSQRRAKRPPPKVCNARKICKLPAIAEPPPVKQLRIASQTLSSSETSHDITEEPTRHDVTEEPRTPISSVVVASLNYAGIYESSRSKATDKMHMESKMRHVDLAVPANAGTSLLVSTATPAISSSALLSMASTAATPAVTPFVPAMEKGEVSLDKSCTVGGDHDDVWRIPRDEMKKRAAQVMARMSWRESSSMNT